MRSAYIEQNSGAGGYLAPYERLTAAVTLTAVEDSGKGFLLDSAGGAYSITLPTATTAAGNVADVAESVAMTNVQLTATDPDSDTVTYAETTSNLSGAGLALSSAGVISGTTGAVGSHTTTSFDVRATAGSKTTDRTFNVITRNIITASFEKSPREST